VRLPAYRAGLPGNIDLIDPIIEEEHHESDAEKGRIY